MAATTVCQQRSQAGLLGRDLGERVRRHGPGQPIAALLLVKGGAAAELLVLEAIRARRSLPLALVVLGDIGGPAAEPVLAALASDRDPAVAEAAREGLRILTARGRPAPP